MAAKAGSLSLIGCENASILHSSAISTFTNSRLSSSSSIATTRRLSLSYFPRPPFSGIQATSGPNSNEPESPFPSSGLQDDLIYLLKLAIGSVLGAALIKYGSAAVPDITRPDISEALFIISSPVVVACLLLINESRQK